MKGQLEMTRDCLVPFQEVRVQQACQIQPIEREQRNFKDLRHQLEFIEEQITLIIILDISKRSQIQMLFPGQFNSFSLKYENYRNQNYMLVFFTWRNI